MNHKTVAVVISFWF